MSWKDKTAHEEASVTLYGNHEVIAEGCKCVTDYSEDALVLVLSRMQLRIRGRELVIRSYLYDQITVGGEILSLEYFGEGASPC